MKNQEKVLEIEILLGWIPPIEFKEFELVEVDPFGRHRDDACLIV